MAWHARIANQPASAVVHFDGGSPNVAATQRRLLTPAGAALTFTGSHPQLGQTAYPLSAAVGFSGGTPALAIGRTVAPSAAPLAFGGGVPQLGAGLRPAAKALGFAGGTPTVRIGLPVFLAAATGNGANVGAGAAITTSITPGAGVATVYAWLVQYAASRGTFTPTCDGTAMTQEGFIDYGTDGISNLYITLFSLKKTFTAGAKTISITTAIGGACAIGGHAYQNANTWSAVITNLGTSNTATLAVPSSADQMVLCVFGGYTTAFSAFNKTSRWNLPWSSGANNSAMSGDSPGSAGLVFSATTATRWGAIGLKIEV